MNTHQYILTIAGLDPSSGAGLTSDIKTFQAHGLYGLSVCTAVTVQNHIDFNASHWMDTSVILQQIETVFEQYKIEVVKIGIVQNWKTLAAILTKLKSLNPTIKVVLDPILKASAGFEFHDKDDLLVLDNILGNVHVITPNYEEIQNLYPEKTIEETIAHLSSKTNLYLKGGHRTDQVGLDQLFRNNALLQNIEPNGNAITPKHGSGCVLSSAIASNLQLGHSIDKAAVLGKRYTEQFLSSNTTLLGDHPTIK